MIWLILTPFLILCLAAVGITLVEAWDRLRARRSNRPTAHWAGTVEHYGQPGKRHSFHPDDQRDGIGA
ncbi:MAG: hypothetical protein MUF52_12440 [Syntrophobacteraceae bacterium]|jgi:hypothetical protein|nr:hypothetical protein [Syntrophobacteraceae bacterium]